MKIKVAFAYDSPPKEYSLDRFEALFEIAYLPHLEFADWKVEQLIRKKCSKAHKKGRIGQLAIWLGNLHKAQLDKAEIPDLTIRWIHESIGYGVFANQPLKKWEYVGEYTGLLRRRHLFWPNINDYCFVYPKEWISLKAFTIDSEKHGNYTRFINHSDTPNCESVSVLHNGVLHILFRTIQPIAAGEELTYDYGSIYWLRRKKPKSAFVVAPD